MDPIGFGGDLRLLRVRKRWRQVDLAAAAGVSRGVVARIEGGSGDRVTVATLSRVAAALGARVSVRLSWNGEALDRLRDAAHASIVEQVLRRLRGSGWQVAAEVSFSIYGERGSIDVLAFHPPTRCLLVVEVKSVIPDVQATLVTIDRKARLARGIAAERGWAGASVGRMLVVRDSRTARRRIDRHVATFGNAFPDRGWAVHRRLAEPDPNRPLHGLWFLSGESQAGARRRVVAPRRRPVRGATESS